MNKPKINTVFVCEMDFTVRDPDKEGRVLARIRDMKLRDKVSEIELQGNPTHPRITVTIRGSDYQGVSKFAAKVIKVITSYKGCEISYAPEEG